MGTHKLTLLAKMEISETSSVEVTRDFEVEVTAPEVAETTLEETIEEPSEPPAAIDVVIELTSLEMEWTYSVALDNVAAGNATTSQAITYGELNRGTAEGLLSFNEETGLFSLSPLYDDTLQGFVDGSPHEVSLRIGNAKHLQTIWFRLEDMLEVETETETGTVEDGDQASGGNANLAVSAGETTK